MRTIYRDVEALSIAGVPVYAERGSNGGIALSDGYRKAIAQFDTDELHALFVAAADPLADLGVTGHERALHKLKGALPDLQRRAADKARERILLDHRKWYRTEQPTETLAVLRRAVWDDRIVELTYRDRESAVTVRRIEPLGLVSKAGIWYIVGRIASGEMRSFRAERIVAVNETPERFERPHDFDLERYWTQSTESMRRAGEGFAATLRVDADACEMLESFFTCTVLEASEREKTLQIAFPSQRAALGHVMMLGGRAQILEPAALRAEALREARTLVERYG